jgi:glycogen(starch) synthase
MTKQASRSNAHDQSALLFEVAWEVCSQLGGIYTVLRTKAQAMVKMLNDRYVLVGPWHADTSTLEFEPEEATGRPAQLMARLQDVGVEAQFGRWLIVGRPQVILLNYLNVFDRLHEIKYRLWHDHGIETPGDDALINNVIAFGEASRMLLASVTQTDNENKCPPVVAHFHEWMAATAIPLLRNENWPGGIVFTTHATQLGRYLAMNDDQFQERLLEYQPDDVARQFNVEAQHRIERAASHGAHVFTTVSDVTARECEHLLGRRPDLLLPNGLNIQRFTALHEFQNLHRQYKQKIHEFTMGHFFPSYSFDLDNTIYMFTAGRYEHRNKGMDLTIESLARLNYRLKQEDSKVTVVAFIITKMPYRSINVTALQSSAMLDEFRTTIDAIKDQIGERLFEQTVAGKMPDLDTLADEYWLMRLRRTMHAWQRAFPPGIVTHDLVDDANDQVLNQLRAARLWNQQTDRVKVVYHPDFITPTNPLFGMEYEQFVRGCHMGIFPSYYEPWGYTPMECIALGVPAVTSDLSGFGSYLQQVLPAHEEHGLFMLHRRYKSFEDAVGAMTNHLLGFTKLNRRERIGLRNRAEAFSVHFDWANLVALYRQAHELALDRPH